MKHHFAMNAGVILLLACTLPACIDKIFGATDFHVGAINQLESATIEVNIIYPKKLKERTLGPGEADEWTVNVRDYDDLSAYSSLNRAAYMDAIFRARIVASSYDPVKYPYLQPGNVSCIKTPELDDTRIQTVAFYVRNFQFAENVCPSA